MMQPDNLKDLPEHKLAYLVMAQLAVASATVANVFRNPKQKPFRPADFLVSLTPREQPPTLREAFAKVQEWAADTPAVVEAKAREMLREAKLDDQIRQCLEPAK